MAKFMMMAVLFISACSTGGANQLYVGPLKPVAGTCDATARAQLVLRGHAVIFAPNGGTLVLTGTMSDSTVSARLMLTGAERKPYPLSFQGVQNGREIIGIYSDVRCRYSVTLHDAG